AVPLEKVRHDGQRLPGRARSLEAETADIPGGQAGRAERLAGKHALVADRDAMLVDAVLETPEPVGLRPEDPGGLVHLGKLEVLAAHGAARWVAARGKLDDPLALARGSVAVLRKQGDPVARPRGERHQRIAAHRSERRPRPFTLSSSSTDDYHGGDVDSPLLVGG